MKTLLDTIISARKDNEAKEADRVVAEAKRKEMELAAEKKKEELIFELQKLKIEADTKETISEERNDKNIPVNILFELSKSMTKLM